MYTIKLTNYAFDNTYTNARLFDSKAERDTYFRNLAGYTFNKDVNFIARDIIDTEIDIKVEPETAPLFVLLNYNYCVIENENEILYFYIRKSEQLSANLIRCRLENDIFQNYFYDAEFSDCLISRAHIDRFIDNGNNTISFDGNANSKLFEREDIKNVAKRLVSRQKLQLEIDETPNSPLNDWLNENVVCWVYISISQGTYNIGAGGTSEYQSVYTGVKRLQDINAQTYYGNSTLCYPILKESHHLEYMTPDGNTYRPSNKFLPYFLNFNNGYANVFSIKYSLKPPIDHLEYYEEDYSISDTGFKLTFNLYNNISNGVVMVGDNQELLSFGDGHVVYALKYDDPGPIRCKLKDTSILPKLTFDKNEIIGANKSPIFNPKINNADYKELQITFCGTSYMYDLQKLNDPDPTFEYYEMVTPDTTKALLQYVPTSTAGVFTEAYAISYNGMSYTNDMSLPFAKGADDQFFANNKNAYLSFQNQQNNRYYQTGVNSLGKIVGNLASGNLIGTAGAVIGTAFDFASTGIQNMYEAAQFDLTIDNMRSAPESLQNINGNAILNYAIAPLGIYVEIYEGLPNELEIANNITYDRGFIFNQYGNIKDFINTRQYFNYIQASLENINADLSNVIKLKLRAIFANGIKLWHTDDIIFNRENYERSIANG